MINLRVLSIAVAICLGMFGAVQLASPESLGISPVAARWLGIIGIGLGLLQGFLPRVQGPTTDPEALADRVWALPPDQRATVASTLADRAARSPSSPVGPPPPAPPLERNTADQIIGLIDQSERGKV